MSDLLKTIYQSKLQKFYQPSTIDPILKKLEIKYQLGESFAVQIERADGLLSVNKFKDCLALTTEL
jgi:hypothetical protein